jgi:hypothetical protein
MVKNKFHNWSYICLLIHMFVEFSQCMNISAADKFDHFAWLIVQDIWALGENAKLA